MLRKRTNLHTDTQKAAADAHPEPYKKPITFLFDFEKTVVDKLKELRIDVCEGSLGSTVDVKNKSHEQKLLQPNYDFPENLHEFDVVMLNLTSHKSEAYDHQRHGINSVRGSSIHALLSEYPEEIFDPRPLAIRHASRHLNELCEKKSIIIAFCGAPYSTRYQYVEVTSSGSHITGQEDLFNLDFYQNIPGYKPRTGKKVKTPDQENKLSPLLKKYLDNIYFETVFTHPNVWKDGASRKAENFIPLLLNERDEIVGYAHSIQSSIIFVFPDIADKPSFVSELFKTYLPEISPDVFPFHGEFKWRDEGDYPLPGEKEILQERERIEENFKRDIAENDSKLASLKIQYKFLSDLITETGTPLVSAIESYLRWLGFDSVKNLDETNPEILEEDIQVDCGDRFLVIEVKGIGGTSTDKDCAQISKIKYRRAEQRGKFDVFGLYIVNHQRYMPPKSRANPPFTENQIKDASHDKRGLLTTYDLYKAYFLAEEGILQKEDIRESLFKIGLITLKPEKIETIGVPHETLMNGMVAIINLHNATIAVGDTLFARKRDEYLKVTIESLQIDGNNVDSCISGEVGIKLNKAIKRNSELFVLKA
jgi:hypothetical protein